MGAGGVRGVDRGLRGAGRPDVLAGVVLLQPRHVARGEPLRLARRGRRRAARALLLALYALRGTPFVYQGEELGLPDAVVPPERVVDVDGRDPERAPLPWRPPSEAGPGAGFTDGEPWLPLIDDAESLCVERQAADPRSTLSLTRRLARAACVRARAAGRRPAPLRPRARGAGMDARRRVPRRRQLRDGAGRRAAAGRRRARPLHRRVTRGRRRAGDAAAQRGCAAPPAVVGSRHAQLDRRPVPALASSAPS